MKRFLLLFWACCWSLVALSMELDRTEGWIEAAPFINQRLLALQFLYGGAMLALLLHNLFIAGMIRDVRYLVHAGYVGFMGLGLLAGNRYGGLLLWHEATAFDAVAPSLFLSLALAAKLVFSGYFLQVERRRPGVSWRWGLGAGGFVLLALLFGAGVYWPLPVRELNLILMLGAVAAGLLSTACIVRALRRGWAGLRYFMLAWVSLWLGVFVAAGRVLGWLPSNAWTVHGLQLASAVEMLWLFLALADQYRGERQRRERAQLRATDARQQMLEHLRLANEQLEQAVGERTRQLQQALQHETEVLTQYRRFGAMISHEFRNPLGIINSQLSLMRKEHEHGELQLDQRLTVLDSACRRLALMFDKWLQNDRLNHTLQDIDPHPIPLRSWLEHFVRGNLHCLTGRAIELREAAVVPRLVSDEYLLEIALGNLVDNARKYAGAESPLVIETRARPGWHGLAVIDQGPGIAPEHQQAVFGEYYRVAPQSGVSGMGLGLSIVRRIAEAHGGSLELQSRPGQGCAFVLWFPEE